MAQLDMHLREKCYILQFCSVISQIRIEILQKYGFNLHIIVSHVHNEKAVSDFFEHVANALVHPCMIVCNSLLFPALSTAYVMLIKMYCNGSLSNSLTPPQHLGTSLH